MWKYSSIYLGFVTRYSYILSFALQPVYAEGKVPTTPSLRGWVGFIAGAKTVTKETILLSRALMLCDAEYLIRYVIFDNCNWIDTRWQ
jgi:hypothetical protein